MKFNAQLSVVLPVCCFLLPQCFERAGIVRNRESSSTIERCVRLTFRMFYCGLLRAGMHCWAYCRKHVKVFTCSLPENIFPHFIKWLNRPTFQWEVGQHVLWTNTRHAVSGSEDEREQRAASITDLFVLLSLLPPPPALQCLSLQPMIHQGVQRLPQHQIPVMKPPHTCTMKHDRVTTFMHQMSCDRWMERYMQTHYFHTRCPGNAWL